MISPPFALDADGVRLAERLTPRTSRNAIDGVTTGADGPARPADGAANTDLIAFLAAGFQLRKADIAILSGDTGRLKMIALRGDGPDIAARLTKQIEQGAIP